MKRILALMSAMLLVLTGCGGTTVENTYQQITQEAAKDMMDTQKVIVLDVREQDEFDAGHIPGAVLLPVGTITTDTAAAVIPELDSVVLGELYLGSESLMPIVVEKGKINISIENSGLEASGTPLNERLYGFIREKNLLEERLSDIHHKQMQQIMDGVSADEAERQAEMESEALAEEMNQLIANFVTSNFDNPLAVQIFSIYCMSFPQPTINKTIQEILDKAPTSFKEDAFVKEYLQHIEENK